ncbi:glycosyltransferase family 4 protein [Paenibacillus chondroitinus]|uniref:Glycosyltransferase family 4 protein n=1 Tax=Paenibacillus chondroitinus TaxID=59842 RepID=A0ABU6DDH5_9BACL|nr:MULTISPECIES: glycosyltransferase family 4 protein [Paenibacillus]MCY9657468.1 glycosyltransferase family 4 protein [Paenibacillus anseongense]MEB4794912.1 glycosyltransferase family 4 protein [Paenibacillus chondroitinus]
MKKKVLFIYPHNFLERNMGTNNRVYEIAKYLKNNNFSIDLYSFENFVSSTFNEFQKYNSEGIIDKLFLYDFNHTQKYVRVSSAKGKLQRLILNLFKLNNIQKNELDDWVTPIMQEQFNEILKNDYDYIVMFYVYTGNLLNFTNEKTKKVYFMEDLLSVGHYITGLSSEIGGPLESEIKRLENFDEIICISNDEKIFFEKILNKKKFRFLPHLVKNKIEEDEINKKDIDLLFIGYDNSYNIEGIRWFLENVYPHLDSKINITIAGKVVEHIEENYSNITKLGYVENLDELYSRTKISMCPLLNGTGMKVKVIEAMSYGIPIVCTSRGVDGFPDKTQNGCLITDNNKEFGHFINQLLNDNNFYQKSLNEVAQYFNKQLSYEQNASSLKEVFK